MKIFIVLIILFVSTNIQAQDQNLFEEYEVAGLGTIFSKLLNNLARKGTDDVIDVLPKPKNSSDDLIPKNLGDDVIINTSRKSNKFPTGQIDEFGININPIAIRITVRELYKKEYESFQEMSKWDCPSTVKNNPLLKELSDTEKCVAYQMSCNVKIETFIHKMKEDKSGLIDVLNATGSGFFINPNTIITNYHVVEGSFVSKINIQPFINNISYPVKIVNFDQENDFAILNFDIKNNKYLHFPSCKLAKINPAINSNVIAIGSPDYRKFDLTKGTLEKYLSKEFNETTDSNLFHWIQMNASINYGSSGGPLYSKRNVIGVNTGSYDDNFISIHYDKLKKFLEKNNVENYGFYMRNIIDGKKIIEFYNYFEKEIN